VQHRLGHCEVQITKILITKGDDTESDQTPYEFVFVNRRGEEKKDKGLIRVNEGWVCSSPFGAFGRRISAFVKKNATWA